MEKDVVEREWQAGTWAVSHLVTKETVPNFADSEPRVVMAHRYSYNGLNGLGVGTEETKNIFMILYRSEGQNNTNIQLTNP